MPIKNDVVEFTVSEKDSSGETFTGSFAAVRRLTPRQMMLADRIRREQLGEHAQYASDDMLNITNMFAHLAVSITKSPQWWKESNGGLDLDSDKIPVIVAIYKKVAEIQGKVEKELTKEAEADKKVLKEVVSKEDDSDE